MKSEFAILNDIWTALDRKQREALSGLSKPNHILLAFYNELESIEGLIRYPEGERDFTREQMRNIIMSFIHALHKTSREKTDNQREMHYLTRDMLRDLGLPNLLRELQVIAPERTRHLYELLIVLNQKIELCRTGVSEISPPIAEYYLSLAQHHEMLLDPSKHDLIADSQVQSLTEAFFKSLKETAALGKRRSLQAENVRDILNQLGLRDFLPLVEKYVPERDGRGFLIYAHGKHTPE